MQTTKLKDPSLLLGNNDGRTAISVSTSQIALVELRAYKMLFCYRFWKLRDDGHKSGTHGGFHRTQRRVVRLDFSLNTSFS